MDGKLLSTVTRAPRAFQTDLEERQLGSQIDGLLSSLNLQSLASEVAPVIQSVYSSIQGAQNGGQGQSPQSSAEASAASPSPTATDDSASATASASADAASTSSASKKKSGLSGGAIAGIVVGSVAAIVIAALLLWFCRRHQRKKTKAAPVTKKSPDMSPVDLTDEPPRRPHLAHGGAGGGGGSGIGSYGSALLANTAEPRVVPYEDPNRSYRQSYISNDSKATTAGTFGANTRSPHFSSPYSGNSPISPNTSSLNQGYGSSIIVPMSAGSPRTSEDHSTMLPSMAHSNSLPHSHSLNHSNSLNSSVSSPSGTWITSSQHLGDLPEDRELDGAGPPSYQHLVHEAQTLVAANPDAQPSTEWGHPNDPNRQFYLPNTISEESWGRPMRGPFPDLRKAPPPTRLMAEGVPMNSNPGAVETIPEGASGRSAAASRLSSSSGGSRPLPPRPPPPGIPTDLNYVEPGQENDMLSRSPTMAQPHVHSHTQPQPQVQPHMHTHPHTHTHMHQ